ncbi:MAG: N-acetyltransferase [Chitinophagaceae bacterium]|nr:MAG: N-acetyltransferase [Chitinophagaceae bacterium]
MTTEPLPEFETERFRLTGFVRADQDFVFRALSHPQVIAFYGVQYASFEATAAQMEWFDTIRREGTGAWWKIVRKADGMPVGSFGYYGHDHGHRKAEIGYWLLPEYWKQGVVREAGSTLLRHFHYTLHIHRVEALVDLGNDNSDRALLGLGFTCEGVLRDYERKQGKYLSLRMWSRLSTDKE